MQKKLREAQFGPRTSEEMETVVAAFTAAFPSLEGVAPHVWGYFHGERESEIAIAAALDAASCDGEWPGQVKKIWSEIVGRDELLLDEVVITPYCGDRVLRITPIGVVTCDYSQRPSVTAAGEVLSLLESGAVRTWNRPVFQD